MFIKWIYKIIPVLFIVCKVDKYFAKSYGFFVLTNPNPPEAIIQHELTHCKQFWRYGWIGYALLYKFSETWRLKFEIEAYKKQLEIMPTGLEVIADFLVTKYGCNITRDQAIRLLGGQNA